MKKTKRFLAALMAALMLTGAMAACSKEPAPTDDNSSAPQSSAVESQPEESQPENNHYPVTITNYNYAGEPVEYTYEKAPEKAIVVYQGCIETMIALGLEDHVMGSYGLDNEVKDEWKDGFAKMNYDETVRTLDKETVTMKDPDFIFSWGSYFSDKKLGDVSNWNSKGIATYMSTNTAPGGTRTLENEYTDILNIGKIFDVEDRAEALVNEMKTAVAEAVEATKDQAPVRVAVLEPYADGAITNYSAKSLGGDMVLQLGGELVKPEGGEMSKEELILADPDVIFIVYMAYDGEDPETVKADKMALITEDPSLASLSAIKNGRVVPIMLGDMYASGPRTVDGIRTFSTGMYPDLNQ